MDFWRGVVWAVLLIGVPGALFGLHRLCLWLEARGHLYYLHKKSSASPMSCLVAVQQALEPQTQHVTQIKDDKPNQSEEAGDPPAPKES